MPDVVAGVRAPQLFSAIETAVLLIASTTCCAIRRSEALMRQRFELVANGGAAHSRKGRPLQSVSDGGGIAILFAGAKRSTR